MASILVLETLTQGARSNPGTVYSCLAKCRVASLLGGMAPQSDEGKNGGGEGEGLRLIRLMGQSRGA